MDKFRANYFAEQVWDGFKGPPIMKGTFFNNPTLDEICVLTYLREVGIPNFFWFQILLKVVF